MSAAGDQYALRLEEELICIICRELLYQPVTLIYCLHSFCGSCLLRYLLRQHRYVVRSSTAAAPGPYHCPICSTLINCISRNATLSNFLDAFLGANPERMRCMGEKEEILLWYRSVRFHLSRPITASNDTLIAALERQKRILPALEPRRKPEDLTLLEPARAAPPRPELPVTQQDWEVLCLAILYGKSLRRGDVPLPSLGQREPLKLGQEMTPQNNTEQEVEEWARVVLEANRAYLSRKLAREQAMAAAGAEIQPVPQRAGARPSTQSAQPRPASLLDGLIDALFPHLHASQGEVEHQFNASRVGCLLVSITIMVFLVFSPLETQYGSKLGSR